MELTLVAGSNLKSCLNQKMQKLSKNELLQKMFGKINIDTHPMTRQEIIQLQNDFDEETLRSGAKLVGYCPIRRALYDDFFLELIRQSTIECQERGLLLLRIKDELKMSMDGLLHLYASAVSYTNRPVIIKQETCEKVDVDKIHAHYKDILEEERFKSQMAIKNLEDEIVFLKKVHATNK
eukprot:NODE_1072_length_2328_cov_0.430238.p2 type:complete len:180 gc:universal NODE_1072_length_2328_cov_0.430238:1579-2118(+)